MPTILFDIPEEEDPEPRIPDRFEFGYDYMLRKSHDRTRDG